MKVLVFAIFLVCTLFVSYSVFAITPSLTSPSSGAINSNSTFSVSGLPSHTKFALSLGSFTVKTFDTNSTGSFSGTFRIPDVPIGHYNLIASANTKFGIYVDTGFPFPMAYDLKDRLYIANYKNQTISVIDINSNETVSSIPVSFNPTTFAYDPIKNYLYSDDDYSNKIFVVDLNSYKTISAIPVSSNTQDMAYDPQNHYLYWLGGGANKIDIIDVNLNKTISTINLEEGSAHLGLYLNQKNGYLYVDNTLEDNSSISVIDVTTQQMLYDIPILNHGMIEKISFDETENRLYVANDNDTIFIIDPVTKKIKSSIYVGFTPQSFYYDVANKRLIVSMIDWRYSTGPAWDITTYSVIKVLYDYNPSTKFEVIQQSNIPEFPFAIPILLISIVSAIVLYRIKFGK